MELEEQVMGIIINAGQSRSLCYEALSCAKEGDFAAADEKMKEAAHFAREAHLVQTQLIEADEGTSYGTLIQVYEMALKAGIRDVVLATRPPAVAP